MTIQPVGGFVSAGAAAVGRVVKGLAPSEYEWAELSAEDIASGELDLALLGSGAVRQVLTTIPATNWTPSDEVNGPQAWLMADAITGLTDGQAIATWVGEVNGKNAVNAIGADQPTYQENEINGKAIIRFDGTSDDLRLSSHGITKPCIIGWVGKNRGGGSTTARAFQGSNLINRVAESVATSNWIMSDATNDLVYNQQPAPATEVDTGTHVHVLTYNGASSRGSYDGTGVTGTINTTAPGVNIDIGSASTAAFMALDMLEFVAFNITGLSAGQITDLEQKLEGYLAWRAGVAANLAYDHPYLTAAPATAFRAQWSDLDLRQYDDIFVRNAEHPNRYNTAQAIFRASPDDPNWDPIAELDDSLTTPETALILVARQLDEDVPEGEGFPGKANYAIMIYQTNSGEQPMQGMSNRILTSRGGSGMGSVILGRGHPDGTEVHGIETTVGSEGTYATVTATNGSNILTDIVPSTVCPVFFVGQPIFSDTTGIPGGTTITGVTGRPGSPTQLELSANVTGMASSPDTLDIYASPGDVQQTIGLLITGSGGEARGGGNPAGVAIAIQSYNEFSHWETGISMGASSLRADTGKGIKFNATEALRVLSVENTTMEDILYLIGNTAATGLHFTSSNTFSTAAILLQAQDIATDTTTGMKIGTGATQKIGFWGGAPIVRPAAYVQTYATANRTLGAYTPDTETSAYTGAADGEAKLADLNSLRVAYENLRVFTEDAVQMLNSLVDDHQAMGLAS